VIVHKIHEFTLHMEIIPFLLRYCVFEYSKCLVCEVRFRNLLNVMFILNPLILGIIVWTLEFLFMLWLWTDGHRME
jgi:hypothetical protein